METGSNACAIREKKFEKFIIKTESFIILESHSFNGKTDKHQQVNRGNFIIEWESIHISIIILYLGQKSTESQTRSGGWVNQLSGSKFSNHSTKMRTKPLLGIQPKPKKDVTSLTFSQFDTKKLIFICVNAIKENAHTQVHTW